MIDHNKRVAYYEKDGTKVRVKNSEGELPGETVRVFTGSSESKKEFLLRVINGEIRDSYNADINAATKLKALQLWNEIEEKEELAKGETGSVINITIGNQGTSFNEDMLKGDSDSSVEVKV